MIFVSASASCAWLGTHLIIMPLLRCSLISFACNCVRNSWQLGGACLLMRSYSDLQSVVMISWWLWFLTEGILLMLIGGCGVGVSSPGGMAANAGGSFSNVSSANCHWHLPSRSHAQNSRIHVKTSTAPANDIASADSVLTTTFWIFFECQTTGFTALLLFSQYLYGIHYLHPLVRIWNFFGCERGIREGHKPQVF